MDSFSLDILELRNPFTTHRLQVHWWSSVKDIKMQLFNITMEPPSHQHIFHSTNPTELKNSWTLHDMGIEESGVVLRVAIDYGSRSAFTLSAANNAILDGACLKMINDVKLGFQKGKVPYPTDQFEGSGGVYFLRSASGAHIAVFKPHDEEQGMPNNPKDHAGTGAVGLREYFHPGQGCLREVAAYIMDYNSFSRVPPTSLVHCEHETFHHPSGRMPGGKGDTFPKLGSLQQFVSGGKDTFDDIGTNMLSVFEVQKIALLDIRILNCDRNGANILVIHKQDDRNESPSDDDLTSGDSNDRSSNLFDSPNPHKSTVFELIPIDHGYCMPSKLNIYEWDWVWYSCSQVDEPIHPDVKAYLMSINIKDLIIKVKQQASISDDCCFLLELSDFLLKQGVEYGLTLKDIASVIVRSADTEHVPSRLESIINEAEDNAYYAIEVKNTRMKTSSGTLHDKKYASDGMSVSTSSESLITDSPRKLSAMDFNATSPLTTKNVKIISNAHKTPSTSVSVLEGSNDILPPIRERGMSAISESSNLTDPAETYDEKQDGDISKKEIVKVGEQVGPSPLMDAFPKPSLALQRYITSVDGSRADMSMKGSSKTCPKTPIEVKLTSLEGTPLSHVKALRQAHGGSGAGGSSLKSKSNDSSFLFNDSTMDKQMVCDPSFEFIPCIDETDYVQPCYPPSEEFVEAKHLETVAVNLNATIPSRAYQKDNDSDICTAPALVRVATFSGFDTSPQYKNVSTRVMGNLKLERRRVLAISDEFKQLRLQFAKDAVTVILGRLANKNKKRNRPVDIL